MSDLEAIDWANLEDAYGCGAYLLVHLEDLPATVTAWGSSSASTTVVPAERLDGDEQRLVTLAQAHGTSPVAEQLRCAFGTLTCPECRVDQPVVDRST